MTSPTPLRNHTLPNHRANRQHVSETMLDAIPESANRGGYVRGRGPRAFTKAFTKMVTSMKPETNPEAALATADEHQTYVYLIDISYSMGELETPSEHRCSRLTYALVQAAYHIASVVKPNSSIMVMAFGIKTDTIIPLYTRGTNFDIAGFSETCFEAIQRLREHSGTMFFTALLETVEKLESTAGNGTTTIVAITDGEASDPEKFKSAHEFICNPPESFDVKLLVIRIDNDMELFDSHVRNLCFYNGEPLPHALYVEAPLPVNMDSHSHEVRTSSHRIHQAFTSIRTTPSSARRVGYPPYMGSAYNPDH